MENPYNTGREKGSSVLGPTLSFKGKLKADEDLLIHGRIQGSIEHSSNLKIGKEGRIDAEVRAKYIEVHGEVQGDLTGSKSVIVRDSANVSGNIYSPKVSLNEGATFNGSIDMSGNGKPEQKRAAKPAAKTKAQAEPSVEKETQAKTADTQKPARKSKVAQKRNADAA